MSLTCKKLIVRYFQRLIAWWKMDSEDILMELWQWNEPRHSQVQPKQVSYNILKDLVFFPSTVFFWHKFWPMAALGRWGPKSCVDMCLPFSRSTVRQLAPIAVIKTLHITDILFLDWDMRTRKQLESFRLFKNYCGKEQRMRSIN